MEPVYCKNGHPNRPGTRICAVCRELMPLPADSTKSAPADPPKPKVASAPPPRPPAASPPAPPPLMPVSDEPTQPDEPVVVAAPAKRGRPWIWLLLLLGFGALCIVAVWTVFLPGMRARGELSTVPATAIAATTPIVVVEPTEKPDPATAAAPTAMASTTTPRATTAVVEVSPTTVATITPLPTIIGVIITPTFAFGRDVNFIQNGDFVDNWANGWTSESNGNGGEIDMTVADGDHEVPAVRLENTGSGMVSLAQRVVMAFPAEGLVFRGRLRLAGTAGGANEGRSALILRYEDVNGEPLGASIWLDGASDSTALWGADPLPQLEDTVNVHIVDEDWQDVELWLGREFDDALPGIDPVAVRQITIMLAVLGGNGCPAAGCRASLEAAGLSLTAEAP